MDLASFTMRGTVLERRGRRLKITGEMIQDDVIVAQSEGLFIVAEVLTEEVDVTTDSQR